MPPRRRFCEVGSASLPGQFNHPLTSWLVQSNEFGCFVNWMSERTKPCFEPSLIDRSGCWKLPWPVTLRQRKLGPAWRTCNRSLPIFNRDSGCLQIWVVYCPCPLPPRHISAKLWTHAQKRGSNWWSGCSPRNLAKTSASQSWVTSITLLMFASLRVQLWRRLRVVSRNERNVSARYFKKWK